KIVLARVFPKSYERVIRISNRSGGQLLEAEEEVFGTDHCAAGRRWAEREELPSELVESIWLHHLPAGLGHQSLNAPEILGAVRSADTLIRRMGIGWSGNQGAMADSPDDVSEDMEAELIRRLEDAWRWLEETDNEPVTVSQPSSSRSIEWLCRGMTSRQSVIETCKLAAEAVHRATEAHSAVFLCDSAAMRIGVADDSGTIGEIVSDLDFSDEGCWEEAEAIYRSRVGHGKTHRKRLNQAGEGTIAGIICSAAEPDLDALGSVIGVTLSQALERERTRLMADQMVSLQRKQAAAQGKSVDAKALETVVNMAAGAAHELNNPLSVIAGRAQILRSRSTDQAVRAETEIIARQAQAASDIVTELMDFARPRPPEAAEVNLREVTGEVARELETSRLLGPGETVLDIRSDTPAVRFDRKYLADLLRELFLNAIDATAPQTRQLTVKAMSDPAEDGVVVDVIDNGRGMTPAIRARALDPFFSWRPAGRGRGLGLSRVVRYLADGGGSLEIRSEPGAGTCIRLRLPTSATNR
ncbi:MAG TPA: ATP-binding protein, partial [Phycisphaerae bacterium]|nr:ATP-binding protein [Phycisphaerae bacterium]